MRPNAIVRSGAAENREEIQSNALFELADQMFV